ncbi:hypothetical protein AAFF_G00416240 [Aldrovandia affinis]|uniref:Uncharacterized protein n=1 Tax=Aldrovandia affinis TaxID=143900 RepID=A0AAD7SAD2_9TELE|nr:hypothetical protein AAFF_G00416240 [Aldrovandia affinis]
MQSDANETGAWQGAPLQRPAITSTVGERERLLSSAPSLLLHATHSRGRVHKPTAGRKPHFGTDRASEGGLPSPGNGKMKGGRGNWAAFIAETSAHLSLRGPLVKTKWLADVQTVVRVGGGGRLSFIPRH